MPYAMNAALKAAVIAEWRGLPEKKIRPDRWQAPGGFAAEADAATRPE